MNPKTNGYRWYALQVRGRWENTTATLLSGRGYRTFLPTCTVARRSCGNSNEQVAPLFPGYVFCQFDVQNRLPVLVTPGVLSVVGRGRIPIPVEDSEINAIQRVVSSGVRTEPWPYLEVGQYVRIQNGPLSGLEGILTSFRGGHRLVVSVSLLCRSVSLEIERSGVCPIQAKLMRGIGSLPVLPVLEEAVA